MADQMTESVYKTVCTHETDEDYNLWQHQGDDDLPDPLALKRNLAEVPDRTDRHKGVQIHAFISKHDRGRIKRLQMRYGLNLSEWIRRAIDIDENIRPPEAKDYIRQIIPEAVATLAERALVEKAETISAIAGRQSDWQARRALNGDSGEYMDAAAYFTDVRKKYERLAQQAHPS